MPKPVKRDAGEVVLQGIGVSPGVVRGQVAILKTGVIDVIEREIEASEVNAEIVRFEEAIINTRSQIRKIQHDLEVKTHMGDASILDAHIMVLDDRAFIEEVISGIKEKRRNAEAMVHEVSERYAGILAAVNDEYLRERVVDVKDVARRVLRNLSGVQEVNLAEIDQKHIIVAADLAPSETASLRKELVLGFVTNMGSPTSHTAVMARALEIPAIVGLRDVTERVVNGDEVLIDGNKGIFIIHPSQEQLERYGKVAEKRKSIESDLTSLKTAPSVTKDGFKITLSANIEGPEEAGSVISHGAEGVGLFRSEYLYLSKDKAIGEDEQAEAYTSVAKALNPQTVIIRTMDIGGDKYLPESYFPRESNPFLGCRSIRLSLLYPEQFKAQLKAILRANVHGNVKIMYPMISSVTEVIKANEILEEAKDEVEKQGFSFQRNIDVGVMIEIPSAALTADVIAKHVKFFSIGTNDLTQYTIAVDRVNERVAYLYEPTHPAVIRLIDETVQAAHRNNIWVGLCGEMAADPLMTPLLLGLGLDELSVAPSSVPMVKDAIRSLTMEQAKELVRDTKNCTTGTEIRGLCRKLIAKAAPELLELV